MKCPHVDELYPRQLRYHLYKTGAPKWVSIDLCCGACKSRLAKSGQVDWAGVWSMELARDVVLHLEGWTE